MHEIPVAARHRLQQHARDTYDVALDVFDWQAVAGMPPQGDLVMPCPWANSLMVPSTPERTA